MTFAIISKPYFELDTRFIATHDQPACLIDLALSRKIDPHLLMKGTGLFYEDILSGQSRICPQQFLKLIDNGGRLLDSEDSSFLFGQRLLPGHHGAASHALRHAANAQTSLVLLIQLRTLLTPLLTPRLWQDEQYLWLYWTHSCGVQDQARFLLESGMTSVVAMCRLLTSQRLPWECFFSYAKPRHIEQYWVHLGQDLYFDQPLSFMRIPHALLLTSYPDTSFTAGQVAQRQSETQLANLGFKTSFLDLVYEYLYEHIQRPPLLEQLAQAFQMSPATLKRKLQKHGTNFQAQLDLVRKHVALYLYWIKRYNNDDVARHLRFNDTTNFRRSFKRWTGLVPSELRGSAPHLI